jgi:uncharacterized iron-regulated membrane protein
MTDFVSALIGAGLLLVAAMLLGSVVTGRSAWMHRLLWPMPWEKHDEETASRNVEFTALVVGVGAGVVGFFFLAGSMISIIA